MHRFKTIIVPVDFSDRSHEALRMAKELAGADGAVHAVHILAPVVPNEPGVIWGTVDDASRAAHVTEAMEVLLSQEGLDHHQHHVDVARGNPAYGVVALAEKLHADLIVVPSTGKTGLAALGSVAERIVRLAKQPVLVIHEGN